MTHLFRGFFVKGKNRQPVLADFNQLMMQRFVITPEYLLVPEGIEQVGAAGTEKTVQEDRRLLPPQEPVPCKPEQCLQVGNGRSAQFSQPPDHGVLREEIFVISARKGDSDTDRIGKKIEAAGMIGVFTIRIVIITKPS
jgi:hypothetical protein